MRHGSLQINEHTEPPVPQARTARLWVQTVNGIPRLRIKYASGYIATLGRDGTFAVRNTSSNPITKGQPLYPTGASGGILTVALASTTTAEALGLAAENIPVNGDGRCMFQGVLEGVDTSTFTDGQPLYVGTTAGTLVPTEPVFPAFVQKLGRVQLAHKNGVIEVLSRTQQNNEQGTVKSSWKIGDNKPGTKTLHFLNGFNLSVTANPTADRSIALPDASGTALLFEQSVTTSSGTAGPFPSPNRVIRTDSTGYINFTLFYNVLDLGTNGSIGRKHTRSIAPPNNPQVGDTWDEIDGSNKLVYGWRWWWDGTYWRSPDLYWDYSGAPTNGIELYVPHNGLNIYVRGYRAISYFQNAQNSLSYWTFGLNRRSTANAVTNVFNANTIGGTTTAWQTLSNTSINTHINVGATSTALFVLNVTPTGLNAGQIFFAYRVIYQFARP